MLFQNRAAVSKLLYYCVVFGAVWQVVLLIVRLKRRVWRLVILRRGLGFTRRLGLFILAACL